MGRTCGWQTGLTGSSDRIQDLLKWITCICGEERRPKHPAQNITWKTEMTKTSLDGTAYMTCSERAATVLLTELLLHTHDWLMGNIQHQLIAGEESASNFSNAFMKSQIRKSWEIIVKYTENTNIKKIFMWLLYASPRFFTSHYISCFHLLVYDRSCILGLKTSHKIRL